MTFESWLLLAVTLIPLGLAVTRRLRVDAAALLTAALLGLLQFAGLGLLGAPGAPQDALKAFAGFSQPAVLTLIGLFILTAGLEKSGISRALARRIIRLGGKSPRRTILLLALASALLSLFMNNLAAGALVLPVALQVARRTGLRPSKVLIPVSFGSMLGGAATYFTTANIIMSNLLPAANPPQAPLGVLDFTPTGGLIALFGIAFLALFGPRLLPDRLPPASRAFNRPSGSELEQMYELDERLWEGRVLSNSALVGMTLAEACIGECFGLTVTAIERSRQLLLAPAAAEKLRAGDTLLVVGREERVRQLEDKGLAVNKEAPGRSLSARGLVVAEAVLAPHSEAEGKTLRELDFARRHGLLVLALRRLNRSYRTDVGGFRLELGDALLLAGRAEQVQAFEYDPQFIMLEPSLEDQPLQRGRAVLSLAIFGAALAASLLGVPTYLAMLVGGLLAILTGVVRMDETYRAIEWQSVFLIAGMSAVSAAMLQTGLARQVGDAVTGLLAPLGPLGLAAGAYLLAAVLTQFIGGQVTALVAGPVVISAAIQMGANPQAVALAAAIGCSTSFFTPLSHPVNILMMAPAGYTFGDFFRIGWRLSLLCFLVLLAGLVLFWGM